MIVFAQNFLIWVLLSDLINKEARADSAIYMRQWHDPSAWLAETGKWAIVADQMVVPCT